jgi:hypothetical protein
MQTRKMPNDHKKGNKWRTGLRPANAFTSEQVRGENSPTRKPEVGCVCKTCGKTFTRKPWLVRQNSAKYCSDACHKIGRTGKNSPLWVVPQPIVVRVGLKQGKKLLNEIREFVGTVGNS